VTFALPTLLPSARGSSLVVRSGTSDTLERRPFWLEGLGESGENKDEEEQSESKNQIQIQNQNVGDVPIPSHSFLDAADSSRTALGVAANAAASSSSSGRSGGGGRVSGSASSTGIRGIRDLKSLTAAANDVSAAVGSMALAVGGTASVALLGGGSKLSHLQCVALVDAGLTAADLEPLRHCLQLGDLCLAGNTVDSLHALPVRRSCAGAYTCCRCLPMALALALPLGPSRSPHSPLTQPITLSLCTLLPSCPLDFL
jgi:hypothetical protein